MSKTTDGPFGRLYVPVSELQTGDCIVNLGIIKAIFPNQPDGSTRIKFDPKRHSSSSSMNYFPKDKLLKA